MEMEDRVMEVVQLLSSFANQPPAGREELELQKIVVLSCASPRADEIGECHYCSRKLFPRLGTLHEHFLHHPDPMHVPRLSSLPASVKKAIVGGNHFMD